MNQNEDNQTQSNEQDTNQNAKDSEVNQEFYSELPRGDQFEEANTDEAEDTVDMGEPKTSLTDSETDYRE